MPESAEILPTTAPRWWIGPLIVALAAAAMLVWTWGTWIDVLIDFGVQLYVPWRLANGEVLYRDIAHYTGPLSTYYNALAFRVAGASLRTLVLANLPVLIGIISLVYYLMLRLGGRLCATMCCLTLIIVFAFARLSSTGNYNYVCPYEYEYTHATFLCLAAMVCLFRFQLSRGIAWSALAGLLVGLVFLTRAELFVAICGAAAIVMLLAIRNRKSWGSLLGTWGAFILTATIPPLLSIVLLAMHMPSRLAIKGTLGMWPAMLKGDVARQAFYRRSMGIDDVGQSLTIIGVWVAVYFLVIAGFVIWSRLAGKTRAREHAIVAAFVGLMIAIGGWNAFAFGPLAALTASKVAASMFHPLPVIALSVLLFALAHWRREANAKSATIAAFALMAFLLLGKIFLNSRASTYGWTLAMPATIVLTACLFGWIPRHLQRRNISPLPYLGGMLAIWSVVLCVHLMLTYSSISKLTVPVGDGPDQIWADARRGPYVNRAVEIARQNIPADKTLACFPEGITINYLAHRRVPTQYVNFNPPDLLLFGEENMLRSLEDSPPDFVMLVHKSTSEFGVPFFGKDYGQSIGWWIAHNYEEIPFPDVDLGKPPLRTGEFGIRVYRRLPR